MSAIPDRSWWSRHADRVIIAVWVLTITTLFLPGAITGAITPKCWLWFCEMPIFYIPYWEYTAAMLKAGFMPVWAPQVHCGFPYICFPGTNLYFPPFYLLMYLDYARSSSVEALICYALGGAFAHQCFRRLGASPLAALVGMLATAGGMYANFESSNFWGEREILAFALCLWGIVGLARVGPRWRYWFGTMVGTALLSFHPEAFLYALMFFAVLPLFLAPAQAPLSGRVRTWVLVMFAVAAGVLAMWAPFLCLYEYAGRSVRGPGLTFEYYVTNKFPLIAYAGMFLPWPGIFKGIYSPWYLGWSVIWLAPLGVRTMGRRAVPLLLAIAGVTLLFINPWPLDWVMYHLPVMDRLIQPYYYFPELLFLVAALAVMGARAALGPAPPGRWNWVAVALISLGLAAIAGSTGRPVQAAALVFPLLLAAAGAVRPAFLAARSRRAALIITLLIGDVTFPSLFNHYYTPMKMFQVHDEARELMQSWGLERYWVVSQDSFTNANVNPNMGMRLDPFWPGTASPLSYWRLAPMRTAEVINLITPGYLEMKDGKLLAHRRENAMGPEPFRPEAEKFLSLINVGWIISQGLEIKGFPRDPHQGELTVYRNPGVLPRARAVSKWRVESDGAKALALMNSPAMDLAAEAVVEPRAPGIIGSNSSEIPPRVDVLATRPGYWMLQTRHVGPAVPAADSLVVVTETLVPGWRAWVDGREAPVHYADHAFMGVVVPAGVRRVELIFQPMSFRLGIWVSMVTLGLWPVWIMVRRLGRRRNISGPGPMEGV